MNPPPETVERKSTWRSRLHFAIAWSTPSANVALRMPPPESDRPTVLGGSLSLSSCGFPSDVTVKGETAFADALLLGRPSRSSTLFSRPALMRRSRTRGRFLALERRGIDGAVAESSISVSAAFSLIMKIGATMKYPGIFGKTDASTTRSPSTP